MLTIAADPKHLGVRTGVLSVLHTWGSALTHHPHVTPLVATTKKLGSRSRKFVDMHVPVTRFH